MKTHLILMSKALLRYQVKTRLAKAIGTNAAYRFHCYALRNNLKLLNKFPNYHLYTSIAPEPFAKHKLLSIPKIKIKKYKALSVIPQADGNIGKKMDMLVKHAPKGKVIIFGSDVIDIQRSDILEAEKKLTHNDIVFGPAEDGGYYLIGFSAKARRRKVFQHIRWSSDYTLSDSINQISGFKYDFISEKTDVDTLETYRKMMLSTQSICIKQNITHEI